MNDTAKIRVFLLDDHEVVRHGLVTCWSRGRHRGGRRVAARPRGHRAHSRAAHRSRGPRRPAPGRRGIDVCRDVRTVDPTIRGLILTSYDDDEALFAAIMAGASGYVLKEVTRHRPHRRRPPRRGRTLPDRPAVTARVLDRVRNGPDRTASSHDLTEQERKLLALVAEGLTNRQIGERMFLAEKTVKNYVSSMLQKLGLERRTQAAVLASRLLGEHPRH